MNLDGVFIGVTYESAHVATLPHYGGRLACMTRART